MSDEKNNRDDRGYKVEDKRRFEQDGTLRENPNGSESDSPADKRTPLPEIDFSTLVISLVTSAMIHLGEAALPDGSHRKELPLAKQTIDIIAMLKEKTRGNLIPEEEKLLEELLYDLRLRYVALSE